MFPHCTMSNDIFFVIFSYLIFSNCLKKLKEKKSEKLFVIKNTDLNRNLLFYNFVVNKIVEKMELESEFSLEYYQQMKDLLIKNIIELYFIIKMQPAEETLLLVNNYKKILIKILEKNPNKMRQFAFDNIEEKFLTLYGFVEKFLEIKKNEKN